MAWENEKSGWLKIAEGDTKEFTVNKITEKQGTNKIKPIAGKDYYYEFDTSEGLLTVNNTGLFFALTGAGVRENDKIRVKYIKKGSIGNPSKFEVNILSKGEAVPF